MLVTCRSTAATVTTSWLAIPALERPSAISSSTSRSRGVRHGEGTRLALAAHQPGDHVGVKHRPALGDPPDRVGEGAQVADLLLQQVADPLGTVGDQGEGVSVLQELGQDQHAHPGLGGPDGERRPQPVVAVIRWHLDVGDDHVRAIRLRHAHEIAGVARRADYVESAFLEDPHDPFPDEGLVLADNDADLLT